MYSNKNYKSKKAIREAIKENGHAGGVYQPGPFGKEPPTEGVATLEGPHYPEAHRWYARVELKDGKITKVLS